MRKQSDTSRFAYDKIMNGGSRETTWKRIIICLQKIGDGTNYEIAQHLNINPEKVWKRTGPNELSCPVNGAIFDTGLRRSSPDGNPAIVYALSSDKDKYAGVTKEKHYMEGITTAGDHVSRLIATTKKQKAIQKELFEQS